MAGADERNSVTTLTRTHRDRDEREGEAGRQTDQTDRQTDSDRKRD